MTISPRASMIWCICVAVLAFLAAGILPGYIPPGYGKNIADTATWLLGLSAALNGVLHAYSAPQSGPLVSPAAAAAAKAELPK